MSSCFSFIVNRIHVITVFIRLKFVKVSDISVLQLIIADLKIKRLQNIIWPKIKTQLKLQTQKISWVISEQYNSKLEDFNLKIEVGVKNPWKSFQGKFSSLHWVDFMLFLLIFLRWSIFLLNAFYWGLFMTCLS